MIATDMTMKGNPDFNKRSYLEKQLTNLETYINELKDARIGKVFDDPDGSGESQSSKRDTFDDYERNACDDRNKNDNAECIIP